MLRAIAAAEKKNDRIDAGKIADWLALRFPAGMPHGIDCHAKHVGPVKLDFAALVKST